MAFDQLVFESQEWVNTTFAGVSGFTPVKADGQTGWETMFTLTRALQHALGISALSDNFGSGTLSALERDIGNVTAKTENSKVVGIMQCGLWCKGYSGGSVFGSFAKSPELTASIPSLNEAMGLRSSVALTPKAFKSLLTMDAYRVIGDGTAASREVQRWLNGTYIGRSDFFVTPCDGLYSRDVQKGLVLAIQYELGLDDGVANGNFGPGTRSGLKTYGNFGVGAKDGARRLVRLFKAALIFNNFAVPFNGTFDSTTAARTAAFQAFVGLPSTGAADFRTWAALLVSTGDPDRPGSASDTSTPLTAAKAAALHSAGYRTVGRYLTVASKRYQPGELDTIFTAGLATFPIYQEYNNSISAFSREAGIGQGEAAMRRVRQLGFTAGAVVYFAVDYDATTDEIYAAIVPFFEGVNDAVKASRISYRVGVYGTRNLCARIQNAGLAVSSFVAGMSYGWSGNLGFRLPDNWSFDQIQTLTVGSGAGEIEIDKNIQSANASVVRSGGVARTPLQRVAGKPAFAEKSYWPWAALGYLADQSVIPELATQHQLNHVVLNRLQKPDYWFDPADPLDPSRNLWTNVYTPSIWTGKEDPVFTNLARGSQRFEGIAGSELYPLPSGGPMGPDGAHFAASTRGGLLWGIPDPGEPAWLGDFGGWGLDLATAWNRYENQRLESPGRALDVRTWFREKIGVDDATSFGRADVQADMAAMLCAKRLLADSSRPVEDVIRELSNAIQDDPAYIAKRFVTERFGNRSGLLVAAKSMFTQVFPVSWALSEFIGPRPPGKSVDRNDPSSTVRASELADVAAGFADAIENAQNWTT